MPSSTRRPHLPTHLSSHLLHACTFLVGFGLCIGTVPAQARSAAAAALKKLTLEELMDIRITSVSGAAERLSGAAAAVSVLTDEDIRRSGATTIPEALRGIPGIHAPHEQWRFTASYAYVDLDLDPHGEDLNRGRFYEGATPRHQFSLHSSLDLPGGWQLDAQFRRSSALQTLPQIVSGEGIPAYSELDLRLAWRTGRTELSILGRNLLHDHHVEFGSVEARGEIERSVYGKIAWGF